ncbi:MAG: DUF4446 family protein [Candidatus Krumholzibacteriia bacterium]
MEVLTGMGLHLSITAAVLSLVALALCVFLFARVHRFTRPFEELARAAETSDLEDLLQAQLQGVDRNQRRIEEILAYTRHLRAQAMNAIQGFGFLRYDAFDDIRGKQSYSLCLLDAHRNGLLITTIAGRTDSRAYAKPIRTGGCEMAISEEETQALEMAKESLSEVDEPVLSGV